MELTLDRISKQFQNHIAVDGFSYTLSNGVYGLLGANGAGKTTLMRMICTVLNPTSGEILFDGTSISDMGARYCDILGYLPQNFGYYPDFSAHEFLLYMASLKGIQGRAAKHRAEELLQMVGLSDVSRQKIRSFSGGMKQRLGVAQAVLNDPKVLVLDEPTAGLDPVGRDEILSNIRAYHDAKNATIILVSHSMEEVAQTVDRVVVINDGTIPLTGTPQEVFSHEKELTAMGLGIPKVTQVCERLRSMGLPIQDGIYTLEAATAELLKLAGKGGAVC